MKIVVLGLGNELLRDEGFGVHVARYLNASGVLPSGIPVIEAGTPGLDALTLLEGFDKAIIVDIVMMGGEPGTVYELRFKKNTAITEPLGITSFHELGFLSVLRTGWSAGLHLPAEVVVVGVEPLDYRSYGLEPTPVIKAAIPRAAQMVKQLATSLAG